MAVAVDIKGAWSLPNPKLFGLKGTNCFAAEEELRITGVFVDSDAFDAKVNPLEKQRPER